MLRGNAIHSTPSRATAPQSDRVIGFRAAGIRASVPKPTTILTKVRPHGAIARRPSAMKRNDAPQTMPGATSSSQSADPDAAFDVVALAESILGRVSAVAFVSIT